MGKLCLCSRGLLNNTWSSWVSQRFGHVLLHNEITNQIAFCFSVLFISKEDLCSFPPLPSPISSVVAFRTLTYHGEHLNSGIFCKHDRSSTCPNLSIVIAQLLVLNVNVGAGRDISLLMQNLRKIALVLTNWYFLSNISSECCRGQMLRPSSGMEVWRIYVGLQIHNLLTRYKGLRWLPIPQHIFKAQTVALVIIKLHESDHSSLGSPPAEEVCLNFYCASAAHAFIWEQFFHVHQRGVSKGTATHWPQKLSGNFLEPWPACRRGFCGLAPVLFLFKSVLVPLVLLCAAPHWSTIPVGVWNTDKPSLNSKNPQVFEGEWWGEESWWLELLAIAGFVLPAA